EKVARLLGEIEEPRPEWLESGRWRHRLKSGQIIHVQITSHVSTFAGRAAVLVLALDVTAQTETEQMLAERNRITSLIADIGIALNQIDSLRSRLQRCVEAVVRHLDSAFARIWTLNEAENILELQASAGLYTHIDGPHARIPVGQFKIGRIAQDRCPHLTNGVIGDSEVHDQEWAGREGMF